jgi:hypothetical protein
MRARHPCRKPATVIVSAIIKAKFNNVATKHRGAIVGKLIEAHHFIPAKLIAVNVINP